MNANHQSVTARRSTLAERVAPSDDYLRESARIAARQFAGGFVPAAANDNQGWPLLARLRRDGNDVLIPVAERYRHVWDVAHAEAPLIGTVQDTSFMSLVQKVADKSDPDPRTKGALSVSGAMPVGDGCSKANRETEEVADRRQTTGAKNPPRRSRTATPKKWTGDNLLIASIDAKRDLIRLQKALGPTLATFELAVIDGETLSDIGHRHGAGASTAGAVGKAIVMLGLSTIQNELWLMSRDSRGMTQE